MAEGETRIRGLLQSEDVQATVEFGAMSFGQGQLVKRGVLRHRVPDGLDQFDAVRHRKPPRLVEDVGLHGGDSTRQLAWSPNGV